MWTDILKERIGQITQRWVDDIMSDGEWRTVTEITNVMWDDYENKSERSPKTSNSIPAKQNLATWLAGNKQYEKNKGRTRNPFNGRLNIVNTYRKV